MQNKPFKVNSSFIPSGDQPKAIEELSSGVLNNAHNQILMGATGSGKTFTMAHVIEKTQKPAIIMAHNKILAAQLYSEMKNFFPNNAVEYFISYFDFYQPEAYIPSKDVYIDKDSQVNSKIEQMKLSAVYSLLERRDTIIVGSVSSIYGIQSKEHYKNSRLDLTLNQEVSIHSLSLTLISMHYERNDINFSRSTFRVRGDSMEIYPAHLEDIALRISFFDNVIEKITTFDPLTNRKIENISFFRLYASYLFATPKDLINNAISSIREELEERIKYFKDNDKFIEAQRIEERTNFDIEMLISTGYCSGIEHYSRHLNSAPPGQTPATIFDYLAEDAILFVDESHVSVPQIRAMYNGDFSRKSTLSQYGFRLPSCVDNRPLKFEEWNEKRPTTVFVSATPSDYELELTEGKITEQIIRPTGLLDPLCEIRPLESQIDDLMHEVKETAKKNQRVLAVTLTKKMAEHLTDYLNENGIKAKYMHSDIDTMERVEIIKGLRIGTFDVLVGINLLREGLDIPECSLVAILDSDKEGFLRSRTSLIQTIGRAARNSEGRVILYADKITKSITAALEETQRRRTLQEEWNKKYNITPTTVVSRITEFDEIYTKNYKAVLEEKEEYNLPDVSLKSLSKLKTSLEKDMQKAAENLDFEKAIKLREKIKTIEQQLLDFN